MWALGYFDNLNASYSAPVLKRKRREEKEKRDKGDRTKMISGRKAEV